MKASNWNESLIFLIVFCIPSMNRKAKHMSGQSLTSLNKSHAKQWPPAYACWQEPQVLADLAFHGYHHKVNRMTDMQVLATNL